MLGESLSHLYIVSAIHFGLLQKKQKQLHIPCEVSWYFWDSWMVLHSQMPFSTRLASTANCTSTGCSSTLLSLGGCTCSQRKETVLSISLARQRKQQLQSCARQVQDVASPAPQWTSVSSTKSLLCSLEKLFMCISTSLSHRYGRWHSQG